MSPDYFTYSDLAARSVLHHFGTRVLGVPGTLIGKVVTPDTRPRAEKFKHWHYWWQAHFLDSAVDAGFRHHRAGDTTQARLWLKQAQALQRGITARNFGSVVNNYYDDMAWLTLALERLNRLHNALYGTGDATAQDAATTLYQHLSEACTQDLGGGAYWSVERNFKNTPATAPIALALARAHRYEEAQALLSWLRAHLWDASGQIYLDGIKITGYTKGLPDTLLEDGAYSYNAGPVLAATFEALGDSARVLGTKHDLTSAQEHAGDIITGVLTHFTTEFEHESETLRLLQTHGSGDGGLFTGILARYLAHVAHSPLLDDASKNTACQLVTDTARVLWAGRREFDPALQANQAGVDVNAIYGESVALFSPTVTVHASDALRPGAAIELSSQLQAWMIFEAAASLV